MPVVRPHDEDAPRPKSIFGPTAEAEAAVPAGPGSLVDLPVPVVSRPQVAHEQVGRLGEELEGAGDALMPLDGAVARVEDDLGVGVHLHQVVGEGHAGEVGRGLVAVEDFVQDLLALRLVGLEERGVALLQHVRVRPDVGHVHAGPEAQVVLERVLEGGGCAAGEAGDDDFEAAFVGEVPLGGVV